MSLLKPAVMRQIACAHSVRGVIREILKVLVPGNWSKSAFSDSDGVFYAKLDKAFATVDELSATRDDYCRKVVEVLCDEVSRLSDLLRGACEGYGYGKIVDRCLSREKFVRILPNADTEKLARIKGVLADRDKSHIDLLRGVGAILDEMPPCESAESGTPERHLAGTGNESVADGIKETIARISVVDAKISEVSEKIDRLSPMRRKRHGRHDSEGPVCLAIWEVDRDDASLRSALNTRVTYDAVFACHRAELAKIGVDSVEKFRRAIHAMQARIHVANKKSLLAAQDAAHEENPPPKRDGFGRISTKKKTT